MNTFALADDLVEPLRPLVDRAVVALLKDGCVTIDRPAKQKLLGLLTTEVIVAGQAGPLMVQLHRVAASLLRCYEDSKARLDLPEVQVHLPELPTNATHPPAPDADESV